MTEVRTGSVPASAALSPGEPLEAVTWICGAHGKVSRGAGEVRRPDGALHWLPPPYEKAGDCSRVVAAMTPRSCPG